ncbi:STAS domain-containing protein [Branchiibius sp. NY16-3462-2]|uniref:STAS domain-containing protein n=1 Tax=Branchiibius sp. NY16-3462-2 TaxID=1807500 RepID=UPI00079757F8|nr:STAS domain-containing protein [Branchiibius sp. NY16-3462-2]KYH46402.1 anti-sigma B factor antagonist [Branchiibius sp. NY16-3462-2]
MEISVTDDGGPGVTVISLAGEADVSTAARLREELVRAVGEGGPAYVVDLSRVPFLDSTALGVLVGRLKAVRSAGGDLVLVTDDQRLLRNFGITGLDKVFRIFPTIGEATAALS